MGKPGPGRHGSDPSEEAVRKLHQKQQMRCPGHAERGRGWGVRNGHSLASNENCVPFIPPGSLALTHITGYGTNARDQVPTAYGLVFTLSFGWFTHTHFPASNFMAPGLYTNNPTIVFPHPGTTDSGIPLFHLQQVQANQPALFSRLCSILGHSEAMRGHPQALRMNKPSNLVPISGRQTSRELSILTWLF